MKPRKVIELILEEIKKKSSINIIEFLNENSLDNVKLKDLIKEIEKVYNKELILDINNTEIYSYDLVYNYFKLNLFKFLENKNDIDLSSDGFSRFKPQDLIRIYCRINSEFLDYLQDHLHKKN
ncbi:MAG: hypothetical protein ACFFAO_16720 [Candidatus Hermodarchaeota archaeon]